jgi:hypothetical protein
MEPVLDELLEEILFRFAADGPARLVHAALVCKRWRRLVSDPGFHRRLRASRRKPAAMLAVVCNVRQELLLQLHRAVGGLARPHRPLVPPSRRRRPRRRLEGRRRTPWPRPSLQDSTGFSGRPHAPRIPGLGPGHGRTDGSTEATCNTIPALECDGALCCRRWL